MSTRILIVASNVDHDESDPSHPTGLWLSELTHAYDIVEGHGFERTIVSPAAGASPLELVDGNLVTSQNPGSAKETATTVGSLPRRGRGQAS